MNRYQAIRIALEAHEGQLDKGGTPYIYHPVAVAARAAAAGEDHEVVAVLHDVVEDTVIELFELEDLGLTADQSEALDAITQREGEGYLTYIDRCCENAFAFIAKMADLSHNLDPERQGNLPPEEAKRLEAKYLEALKRIVKMPLFEFVNLHNSTRPEYAWYGELVARVSG